MSSVSRLLRILAVAALLVPALAASQQFDCRGDCDGDGMVDEEDLRLGIEALFDPEPGVLCDALVGGDESRATAADVLAAVRQSGDECPVVEPPMIAPLAVYRTYPEFPIELPIVAEDPHGPLVFEADDLPEGASLDAQTGVFRWLPRQDQVGPFYVPIRVTNQADPPATAERTLALHVAPQDGCSATPDCDPATGCTNTLPPLDQPCCTAGPAEVRVAEVVADCPEGGVLMVGRNVQSGFGRLHNCDRIRLSGATQAGVVVRVNLAARCVNTRQFLIVDSRLETATGVYIDRRNVDVIVLTRTDTGFLQYPNLSLGTRDTSMALNDQEANLTITLREPFEGGIELTETVRVILGHDLLPDLPDSF